MAKKKKSNNPAGRPSSGLAEASVLVRLPDALLVRARAAAGAQGISLAVWWREAALMRLRCSPDDVGVPERDVEAVR